MTSNNKPSSRKVLKGEETGTLQEHVDLSPQASDQNKSESEMLLPHERDQTAGPAGTDGPPQDEHSRNLMMKAYDDTKSGLKDTDCHGIPSDIDKSGSPCKTGNSEIDVEDKPS